MIAIDRKSEKCLTQLRSVFQIWSGLNHEIASVEAKWDKGEYTVRSEIDNWCFHEREELYSTAIHRNICLNSTHCLLPGHQKFTQIFSYLFPTGSLGAEQQRPCTDRSSYVSPPMGRIDIRPQKARRQPICI